MTSSSDRYKHLRLEVPNYDRSGHGKAPNTYLQLGAYPTEGTAQERGDDLLERIGLTTTALYFKDDYRHANAKAGVDPAPTYGQQHPDVKYWRDDGLTRTNSTPQTLTGELLTRGGWRLHTDGNYVSTTRGDRVDVIGGNYKLVILGRTDAGKAGSVLSESFWESSGGHTVDGTNWPGTCVSVAWNKAKETWRVVSETVKGDCIERYEGIVEEEFTGPEIISNIGFDPTPPAAGATPWPPDLPTSSASNHGGAHTQTDQDTSWINPSSGPGAPPATPGWPRKQQNPTVEETIKAKTITETIDAGTIDQSMTANKKSETFTAWGGALLDQTDAKTSGATYAMCRGTASRPTGYHHDLKFAIGLGATELFETFVQSGQGNWSFNLNLVAQTVEAEIFGAKAVLAVNRWESSFFYGRAYEASLAARLSVQVGGELTFKLVETLESTQGPHKSYGLVELGLGMLRKRTMALQEKALGTELKTRGNDVQP